MDRLIEDGRRLRNYVTLLQARTILLEGAEEIIQGAVDDGTGRGLTNDEQCKIACLIERAEGLAREVTDLRSKLHDEIQAGVVALVSSTPSQW